jgi:hypothetical protein
MATSNKIGIEAFEQSIQINSSIKIPTPKELLSDEDYNLVTEAFNVVSKYRDPNWISTLSLSEMQSDLMYLQATQVTIMYRMGVLASYASTTEEQVKIARSKVRVNGKSIKQDIEQKGDVTTVTLDDIKELSYTKTENIWAQAEEKRVAAEFVKFIYFAIKDHIFMLNNTIQRLFRVE